MSTRARLVVAILWIVSLVGVASIVHAQAPRMVPLASPVVVSGNDLGFRVEGHVGNRPAGVLVVRVGGEWVIPTTQNGWVLSASR